MPITCSCGTDLEVMDARMATNDQDELVLTIKVASCDGCDDTATKEQGVLEDRIIELEDKVVDLTDQTEDLGTQISQLEQDDFDSRLQIQELSEENQNLIESVESLGEDNKDLESTISDLKEEMIIASERGDD